MEDSQNPGPPNFQQQLLNLSSLQQQIERTQREVSQMLKIENNQGRLLETIYKQSLQAARNKLNLIHSHQSQENLHSLHRDTLQARQHHSKQLREKNQLELREVRDVLQKSREEERLVIRNNSRRYNLTIQKNKQADKELKAQLVKDTRQGKENYKHSLAESRLQESKNKEAELFRSTLAKINRQPILLKQLEGLNHEKAALSQLLEERRNLREQLSGEVDKLRRMKLQDERVEAKEEKMKLTRCVGSMETLKTVLLVRHPNLKLEL